MQQLLHTSVQKILVLSASDSIHKPRKPQFKFSLSLSLSLSFSLHQLFFSYMSLRYHRISFLKTAVNNVSVPDLSALERTVWNFLATCIELGQLKKRVTWHFVIGWWVGIARDIKKAGCREVCRAFGKSGFSCWRGTWVCPDVSGVV